MRIFIIAVVVLLIVFFIIRGITIYNRIKFDFSKAFRGVDLKQIDVSGLGIDLSQIDLDHFNLTDAIKGQGKVTPILSLDIVNDNGFPISFKDIKATFYFNNTLVGETSNDFYQKTNEELKLLPNEKTIPANDTLTIQNVAYIYLNKEGARLIQNKYFKKEKVNFKYTVKLKILVLGAYIPISYSDTIEW